jgi:long-chain acyl-CoA synthetase
VQIGAKHTLLPVKRSSKDLATFIYTQYQNSRGALVVPNVEAPKKWAETENLTLCIQKDNVTLAGSQEINLESKIIQDLFRQELNREVQNRPGYRPDDRIEPFRLILEPFSLENGLMTQTLKVRRHVVMERYRDTINNMFAPASTTVN